MNIEEELRKLVVCLPFTKAVELCKTDSEVLYQNKKKIQLIEQQTRGVTRLSNINCEIMLRLLLLVVALSSVVGGEITLAGIEFGDNFGQEYLTADNGIAIARTEVN